MKNNQYGYGKVLYQTLADFPDQVEIDGETFYKTHWELETINTGMLVAEYWADPYLEDDSKRRYMDAAGNISYS